MNPEKLGPQRMNPEKLGTGFFFGLFANAGCRSAGCRANGPAASPGQQPGHFTQLQFVPKLKTRPRPNL